MALSFHQLEAMLKTAFPNADIQLEDLAGDGDHFALEIVCSSFLGKSRVQRHQLVYGALNGCMGRQLHALSIRAFTPQEAAVTLQPPIP